MIVEFTVWVSDIQSSDVRKFGYEYRVHETDSQDLKSYNIFNIPDTNIKMLINNTFHKT